MKNLLYKTFLYIFATLICLNWSCSKVNDFEPKNNSLNYIDISLKGISEIETRVSMNDFDCYSTSGFSTGDAIGFFATEGILSSEDGSVINEKLDFQGSYSEYGFRFGNASIRFPNDYLIGFGFAYFPYNEVMNNALNLDSTEGMDLRVQSGDMTRCIDFLSGSLTSTSATSVSPQFSHNFSEVIILRGEGFDKPKDPTIKVVAKYPCTDVRVVATGINEETGKATGWKYTLIYNGDDTAEERLKARTWEAWKGNNWRNGQEAWYAIIPTWRNEITSKYNELSYIEAYDNYGNLQKVSDFKLASLSTTSNIKTLQSGCRYILSIVMTPYGAQVRPVDIQDWNDPIDITDKREKGITDYSDYEDWVLAYNDYNENRVSPEGKYIETLEKYGDHIENDEGQILSWIFYITDNIKFNNQSFYQVKNLQDKIEGGSYHSNFVISNIRYPLFEKISDGGSISYLNFENVFIQSSSTDPVGIIANSIQNGVINNCNINHASLSSLGPVGMIAGTLVGGKVSNVRVSGSIFGSQTYGTPGSVNFGLFGNEPSGNYQFSNNNSTSVIFENK